MWQDGHRSIDYVPHPATPRPYRGRRDLVSRPESPGRKAETLNSLIDASDLGIDERVRRLESLARRRRVGGRWWARFLQRLDELEEAHFSGEWTALSRASLGRAAADLFDPVTNSSAQ